MQFLITSIGVLAALILLGVSGTMNFLFLSSLGKTALEGYVLGAASAAADTLKAFLPFYILHAWQNGRHLVAIPGCLVWLLFVCFSLLSAVGFAAENRYWQLDSRTQLQDRLKTAKTDLERAKSKLQTLPEHRPATVVQAELERLKQSVRWTSSRSCTNATVTASRTFCDRYFNVKGEFEAAQAGDVLGKQIAARRAVIADLKEQGANQPKEVQVSILHDISGFAEATVRLALIVIVSVVVEAGSSLGLILATQSRRRSGRKTTWQNNKPTEPSEEDSAPLGLVEDFSVDQVFYDAANAVETEQLYDAYQDWCIRSGVEAKSKVRFIHRFDKLAGILHLEQTATGYRGITLKPVIH